MQILAKDNAHSGWRVSSQRQTWTRDTLVKSQLFCTQELAITTTKPVITSVFSWFGSVLKQFLCHGFSNDPQSLSHLEQGSSYAMRCPHNHIFWRVYPILAESFVQTEQKSFMTLARDFSLHGNAWGSENAKIVGEGLRLSTAPPCTP